MSTDAPDCALLFVDDDPKAGELLQRFCVGSPYRCETFRDPKEALSHFERHGADVVVTDLRMPGMDGLELLARIRTLDTEVPVIIVTAYSRLEHAIEALRHGASDFLKKPFDMEELMLVVDKTLERSRLHRENRLLRRELQSERRQLGLVGASAALRHTYNLLERVADVRCNVIIRGESGTGKELAARAIHTLGPAPDTPFIVVDCGALSDTLLESELFGHEKGAFTGASAMKRGLFEVARGGTVFLDEIGNISEAMQVRLLRVIQERQITRVGGVRPIDVDVRCLVATNADLQAMVREGGFRADLFHRLNVVTVTMPPLRERREDIPALLQHFVSHFAAEYGRDVVGFDAASVRRLERYPWPGNVRELRNLVERHVVLADQPMMRLEGLPDDTGETAVAAVTDNLPTLAELEWRYIQQVLQHCDGNRGRAAALLGIDKSTLWRKLERYQRAGSPPRPES
ncbi:MAG: sigma-54-dependent Fis family transcriptional regulator [Gammaproteobacteria bacterium]|nr:sigma-54-dependent Fis family transcriptional regulator [Gammaproteobacteria bacterium]